MTGRLTVVLDEVAERSPTTVGRYAAALARGLGDGDFAGVIEAIEGLAGTRL